MTKRTTQIRTVNIHAIWAFPLFVKSTFINIRSTTVSSFTIIALEWYHVWGIPHYYSFEVSTSGKKNESILLILNDLWEKYNNLSHKRKRYFISRALFGLLVIVSTSKLEDLFIIKESAEAASLRLPIHCQFPYLLLSHRQNKPASNTWTYSCLYELRKKQPQGFFNLVVFRCL